TGGGRGSNRRGRTRGPRRPDLVGLGWGGCPSRNSFLGGVKVRRGSAGGRPIQELLPAGGQGERELCLAAARAHPPGHLQPAGWPAPAMAITSPPWCARRPLEQAARGGCVRGWWV